jgi:hypothetical protein
MVEKRTSQFLGRSISVSLFNLTASLLRDKSGGLCPPE